MQLPPVNGEAQQESSSPSPTVETVDAITTGKRAANGDAATAPAVRVSASLAHVARTDV